MIDIRQGTTIVCQWKIKTNGEEIPLNGRDFTLFISSAFSSEEIKDFEILNDIIILLKIEGNKELKCGRYTLTLYENYGKQNQTVVDSCNAFNLVKRTCDINNKEVNDNLQISFVNLQGEISVVYGGDFTNDYLRYSEQLLTDEQKQQVLKNLDIQNVIVFTNEEEVEL